MVAHGGKAEHQNEFAHIARLRESVGDEDGADDECVEDINPGPIPAPSTEPVVQDDEGTHRGNRKMGYMGQPAGANRNQQRAQNEHMCGANHLTGVHGLCARFY